MSAHKAADTEPPHGVYDMVIGHVERTWPCAFLWPDAGPQLAVYRGLLRLLLRGSRIGWAMEQFNARYAELASQLATIVSKVKYDGFQANKDEVAYLWTARNDARSLIVLGDPAVRLKAPVRPPRDRDPAGTMGGTMSGPRARRKPAAVPAKPRSKRRALLGVVDYTFAKRALLRDFRLLASWCCAFSSLTCTSTRCEPVSVPLCRACS